MCNVIQHYITGFGFSKNFWIRLVIIEYNFDSNNVTIGSIINSAANIKLDI